VIWVTPVGTTKLCEEPVYEKVTDVEQGPQAHMAVHVCDAFIPQACVELGVHGP
jgi:hypothetical protein